MGEKKMDLKKINSEIEKFVSDRDWDQFHSVKNLSMALSVESSELLEIFQWLTEEQSNQIKNDPKLMGKVEDEVADVFVYLDTVQFEKNSFINRNKIKTPQGVLWLTIPVKST